MQDFTNLKVWQTARAVAKLIYEVSVPLPPEEQFGLKAQIRRSSISICANIAEGCGRGGDPDFKRFLLIAMGSACELECELILARDLKMLDGPPQTKAVARVRDVKRMLSGLIKTVGGSAS